MASTAAVKAPLTDAEAREVKASAEKEYWRGARVRATMWALTFPGHFASINDGKESACVNADDEMGQVEAREAKARAKELEMRVALSRCRAARAEWLRLQNARTARREHLGVTVSRRVPLAAASSVQVVAAAPPPRRPVGRPRIAGCFQCRFLARRPGQPGGNAHTCGGPASAEYQHWARVRATVRAQTLAGHGAAGPGKKRSEPGTVRKKVKRAVGARR